MVDPIRVTRHALRPLDDVKGLHPERLARADHRRAVVRIVRRIEEHRHAREPLGHIVHGSERERLAAVADVLPVADYGVRKGFQKTYKKRELPIEHRRQTEVNRQYAIRARARIGKW